MISQDDILRRQHTAALKAKLDRLAEIQYARDEGIEKGIEKGIQKGIVAGQKRTLVDILTLRFGASEDWEALLALVGSEEALGALTAVVVRAADTEAVMTAIAAARDGQGLNGGQG